MPRDVHKAPSPFPHVNNRASEVLRLCVNQILTYLRITKIFVEHIFICGSHVTFVNHSLFTCGPRIIHSQVIQMDADYTWHGRPVFFSFFFSFREHFYVPSIIRNSVKLPIWSSIPHLSGGFFLPTLKHASFFCVHSWVVHGNIAYYQHNETDNWV